MKNPTAASICRPIPPLLSVYLDIIRFAAAVMVVLFHTWREFYPDSKIRWPGHEAVVVFFVLSGYVIAHSASRPDVTLFDYMRNRIARIVPVAWLALALGFVISLDGDEPTFSATLTNMIFIAQSGLLEVEPPGNPAFWSLNYEVWYYVIFGAWLFSPRKYRLLFTVIAIALAGPKIVLLFPVWLMGVWLYRKTPTFSPGLARAVAFGSAAVAAAMFWSELSDTLRAWLYAVFPPAWRFHYSTQVLYDLILGVVVCAHFAAVASLGHSLSITASVEGVIRYLASFTFSIYVFHSPLGALHQPGMSAWQFYCLLAVAIFGLAQLSERRVKFFRSILSRAWWERWLLPREAT